MATGLVRATTAELYEVDGKAELIGGEIVLLMGTGLWPGMIGLTIASSLRTYSRAVGRGVAVPDNVGFTVPELSSGRESFSPDAAYYTGPIPANPMRFAPGPPDFAVEVRSENDYGPAAEVGVAAKRADYFEAGTQVVWDVDPIGRVVRAYRAADPGTPAVFGPGAAADAEPAVPGWRIAVDEVFG